MKIAVDLPPRLIRALDLFALAVGYGVDERQPRDDPRSHTIAMILDRVDDGMFRPGSWERPMVEKMAAGHRLNWTRAVERDPERPWRLRPRDDLELLWTAAEGRRYSADEDTLALAVAELAAAVRGEPRLEWIVALADSLIAMGHPAVVLARWVADLVASERASAQLGAQRPGLVDRLAALPRRTQAKVEPDVDPSIDRDVEPSIGPVDRLALKMMDRDDLEDLVIDLIAKLEATR